MSARTLPKMDPNYFDLQVNGFGGVDFNQDDLTPDQLNHACERLQKESIGGFLATIITDTFDRMEHRLRQLVTLRNSSDLCKKLIAGIHIEGPFLSPLQGYRGAHPLDAIVPADVDQMNRLLDAAGGLTKLVTLAPEHDEGVRVTRMLASKDIRVSAGHCDPTLDQLRAAIDAGVSLFTHLGNGCPMQLHRHDNIIQRVLSLRDKLWICFIADCVHVPTPALANYIRLIGIDHTIVVTDAIAPAGFGPGRFKLGRWDLLIGDDMVARAPDGSHFVGAAITMNQSVNNLVQKVGLSQSEGMQLVTTNPRRALGIV